MKDMIKRGREEAEKVTIGYLLRHRWMGEGGRQEEDWQEGEKERKKES